MDIPALTVAVSSGNQTAGISKTSVCILPRRGELWLMTSHTPESELPPNLTPEQKKDAERRIAPLLHALLNVGRLRLGVMNLLLQVGPDPFDPQEIHHLLTNHFEEAKQAFEIDLLRVKRMLALEALRAAGQLSAEGRTTKHALDEKLQSMEANTRALRRQARAQASATESDLSPSHDGVSPVR
jgi:hypothetical protein